MTNFEFLMSENTTPSDLANLMCSGCYRCIFNGKFESCYDVGVTCKKGFELWLQSKHIEEVEE